MLGRSTKAIRVQAVPQAAAAHPQQARRPREITPALTQGVGEALGLVEGDVRLVKITTAADLAFAEALLDR